MSQSFIPSSSSSPIAIFHNLLNTRLDFVLPGRTATLITEAEAVHNGHAERAVQVDRKEVDLKQCFVRQDVAPGVQIVAKIAGDLPAVLMNPYAEFEIAALLSTEAFWTFDSDAVRAALPDGSPYQLGDPTRSAVNITRQGNGLLIHKTTYWHAFTKDGLASRMDNDQPVLETDVAIFISLQQTKAPRRDGTRSEMLGAKILYCDFNTPDAPLKEHLLRHKDSLLTRLFNALKDIFCQAGYYFDTACTYVWGNCVMPTRPSLSTFAPAPDNPDLRKLRQTAFDADMRAYSYMNNARTCGSAKLKTKGAVTVREHGGRTVKEGLDREVGLEARTAIWISESQAYTAMLEQENERLRQELQRRQAANPDDLPPPPPPDEAIHLEEAVGLPPPPPLEQN